MIKPGQNCLIVDHPDGEFRPGLGLLNKLVKTKYQASIPNCCIHCALAYAMGLLTEGVLWEIIALQTLTLDEETILAGEVAILPRKNLAPLPDLGDEPEQAFIPKELEKTL